MELKIETNIPFPKKDNKEIVEALLNLKEGDCTYLSFQQFNKTVINNCIANARIRIASKGLMFKTLGDEKGRRIWVFKK